MPWLISIRQSEPPGSQDALIVYVPGAADLHRPPAEYTVAGLMLALVKPTWRSFRRDRLPGHLLRRRRDGPSAVWLPPPRPALRKNVPP